MPLGPDYAQILSSGQACLGIEFGSTRIKASLVTPDGEAFASGVHSWENRLVDGHWSYSLDAIWEGIAGAYASLVNECQEKYGVVATTYSALGISAMMHGYMAFDKDANLLVPFRTWRDTTTGRAAEALTAAFNFNIPLRWSIAHYYQAMLDNEPHVPSVDFFTTLAGYVHWKLTGKKVIGVGDASGMFPISDDGSTYVPEFIEKFNNIAGDGRNVADLLPEVLPAGADAGTLSEEGARLIDPSGKLQAGVLCAPPEGDAGTGMVATNAVRPRTGNVSVGTSIFLMAVLEKTLKNVHPELDIVTTPDGAQVAMVHCNNGADEMSRWVEMFREVGIALGAPDVSSDTIYAAMLGAALDGEPDAGGVLAYNNLSGEPVVNLTEGRPLITRAPWATLNLANFMRSQVYSTFAALAIGLEVLEKEDVHLDILSAHGGVFRTEKVAQRLLAAATHTPITVPDGASEGGSWGMAVLAAYVAYCKKNGAKTHALPDFLDEVVFASASNATISPSTVDERGFATFLAGYRQGLTIQSSAISALPPRAL
ncbi:xylulokinase [Actinotignum urinale]|uniref:xylulokinase n=1 Tax=Actinotignum urinale TaxID=190146 RepID=UPI0003B3A792|nr:FGGY-family carbohydrate kinase [Actinotignum urinale]MDY5160378.1 FGGY-family carbohydrate kinase [Actinotignum urinale]